MDVYTVTWTIDVEAENPLDAAIKAQHTMHEPVAWDFDVSISPGQVERIELEYDHSRPNRDEDVYIRRIPIDGDFR
jgi:hypothetical protein